MAVAAACEERTQQLRALNAASARAEAMDARTLKTHARLLHHPSATATASSSAATAAAAATALSCTLSDFTVQGRLGKRHTPVGGSNYYGVNSAVYLMQLQLLGVDVTFAVKAVYNLLSPAVRMARCGARTISYILRGVESHDPHTYARRIFTHYQHPHPTTLLTLHDMYIFICPLHIYPP